MKKEKSLTILGRRCMMSFLLVFGILLMSSNAAVAQNPGFDKRIHNMTELRDSFVPGTAKYDLVQDAIEYLNVLEAGFNADPFYLENLRDSGQDPFLATPIRKTHPSILANYSVAQLGTVEAELNDANALLNMGPQAVQKRQWVLDANAY